MKTTTRRAALLCWVGMLLLLSGVACAEEAIRVVGVWNGFHEHTNIIECVNPSAKKITATLRLTNSAREEIASVPFRIVGKGTVHLPLNDYPIQNDYGLFEITLKSGRQPFCSTTFYRFASDPLEEKQVQYAFSLPAGRALRGTVSGTYNSMNPEGTATPVHNWLSIYNLSEKSFSAKLEVYRLDGTLDTSQSRTLNRLRAGERRDIPLGHELGQQVGMYRIVPKVSTQEYGSVLSRFSLKDGNRYNFSFPLIPSAGSCDTDRFQPRPWRSAELARDRKRLKRGGGCRGCTSSTRWHTAPCEHSTLSTAFPAAYRCKPVSRANSLGWFRVRCKNSNKPLSILAQSIFYGFDPLQAQQINWAYASQSNPYAANAKTFVSTYNTFLEAANWLKLLNPNISAATTEVGLYDATGSQQLRDLSRNARSGALDYDIHSQVGSNTFGFVTTHVSKGTFPNAELIRVYPTASGNIGYIMNPPTYPALMVNGEPRWMNDQEGGNSIPGGGSPGGNTRPTARSTSFTTALQKAKNITLVANDPDGDSLTWAIVGAPQHGTLSGTAPKLRYTPHAGFHGDDSFTFRVSDGALNSNIATVAIVVAASSAPAISAPSTSETLEGPVSFTLTYAEAKAISLSPSHVVLNSDSGVKATVSITGSGLNQRTVTLSNISGHGTASISVAPASSVDAQGIPSLGAGPSATFVVRGVLEPGAGFSSPTPQPETVGSGAGSDAKAIARWDVVPFQSFKDYFEVGVVAFHINGIDRVEFSVNGGPWLAVREMTLNPRTRVVEYWTGLDAKDFPDGPIEIRAIAFPKVGVPRVLQDASGGDYGEQSLKLFTNAQESLPNSNRSISIDNAGNDVTGDGTAAKPYQTLARALYQLKTAGDLTCEGATIFLNEGTYYYPDTEPSSSLETYKFAGDCATNRWLTISGAPGSTRADVVMTHNPLQSSGVMQRKIHLTNLSMRYANNAAAIISKRSDPYNNHFWLDDVSIAGNGFIGETITTAKAVSGMVHFSTEVELRDVQANVFTNDILVRNVHARNLGGDFIRTNKLIVNCSVTHMRHNYGVHPDVVQIFIPGTDNMIVYNLQAFDFNAQGLGIATATNSAFVNIMLQQMPDDPQYTYLASSGDNHILYWNNTYYAINARAIDSNVNTKNISFRNNIVEAGIASHLPSLPGYQIDNNHFRVTAPFGTNATSGGTRAELFVDDVNGDFRPRTDSVLVNRVPKESVLVPVDVNNQLVPTDGSASIGPLQR